MPKLQSTSFRQFQMVIEASTCLSALDLSGTFRLSNDDHDDVLNFLKKRPVHTVVMMSMINDNGLVSELNRGRFYGYRGTDGELEGVALIGHTTLVEARSEKSLKAFAQFAKKSETPVKLMMSDGKNIEAFWQYYSDGLRQPRLTCEEHLFELSFPFFHRPSEWNVRNALESELKIVAEAHAEVAFEESGVNPLENDREGFLKRARRRIQQGRTFVVFSRGNFVFKADIAAQTEDVIYLEGIYVAPQFRGRGIGAECLAKVAAQLLEKAYHVCLLSNVKFTAAHKMYSKAGFKSQDCCTTLFV